MCAVLTFASDLKKQLKYLENLDNAEQSGTVRLLPDYSSCSVDFVSNDYLGMAQIQFSGAPISFSGKGSRLIAGNSREAMYCESYLAEHFKAEAALVFNSGYDANLGFFSTVPQKNEVVLYDESIHASIRDGLRLSWAKSYSFKHNDLNDLRRLLNKFPENNAIIVVESVYSMDGDAAPLYELFNLAIQYDAFVVVDEAHSVGIHGLNGLGKGEEFAEHPNLLARVVTFGKAIGAHGAAVLCSEALKKFLIHACRSFIYTTALPPEAYQRILHCFNYLADRPEIRLQLEEQVHYFSKRFEVQQQHIQMLAVGGIDSIKRVVTAAKNQGIALKGVWSPTVAPGQEKLRISLHTFNKKAEIEALYEFLKPLLSNG